MKEQFLRTIKHPQSQTFESRETEVQTQKIHQKFEKQNNGKEKN